MSIEVGEKFSAHHKSVFKKTLKSARLGLADAQYEVGLMFANGVGVAQNLDQAVHWIRQSADKGFVSAQYLLATRYASGVAIEKDEHKALVWYLKAAEQGHPKAFFRLGKMHSAVHPESAFSCFVKAADIGLAEAQMAVADAFASGIGVHQDWSKAVHRYAEAAEQGLASAQCALADLYSTGHAVPLDIQTAFGWYRKAARQFYAPAQVAMCLLDAKSVGRSTNGSSRRKPGAAERRRSQSDWENASANADARGKYYFGLMWELGLGVPQSDDMAEAWYLKAALQEDGGAQLALARLLEKRHDFAAIGWYTKAAEGGDKDAQYALGRVLASVQGAGRDCLQAAFWYAQAGKQHDGQALMALSYLYRDHGDELALASLVLAAQQGVAQAQFLLGERTASGKGVNKSDEAAFDWFWRAAQQGHPAAQCAVASFYLDGRVVAQDFELAISWFHKAAEQGNAKAQWNIGSIYAGGDLGIKKDLRQAFLWCQKAADSGFAPAQATLGVLCTRIKDFDRAAYWLQKAAEQGDPEAQYNLAISYIKGQGLMKDPERALYWFTEAAHKGVVHAQAQLGLLYAVGEVVAVDPIEAHKWHIIAAENQSKAGRANLMRSEAKINPMQIAEAQRRAKAWAANSLM